MTEELSPPEPAQPAGFRQDGPALDPDLESLEAES